MEKLTQLLAMVNELEETIGVAPNLLLWAVPLLLLLEILAFIPVVKEHKDFVVDYFKIWLISIVPMVIGEFIHPVVGAFLGLPCALLTMFAAAAIALNFGWQIVKLILFVFSFGNLGSETYRNGYSESQYRANGGSTGVKW